MAALIFEWHGLACFKITVKQDVGEVTILTDPFGPSAGIKMPRGVGADIVIVSRPDPQARAADLVAGSPFVISHPGEYEVKGVFVYGIPVAPSDSAATAGARVSTATKNSSQTIYRIEAASLSLAYLGDLSRPPSDAALQGVGEADVLLLPVGGQGRSLTAASAAEILTSLEPRVVIPMFFKIPGLTEQLDPPEKFVKESGLVPERAARVKLTKKDLPPEETKLYLLTA